jgi:hypothetical protein
MTDMVQVPVSFWDKLTAFIIPKERETEPEREPAPVQPDNDGPSTDEYEAAITERDDLKAKLAEYESAQQKAERVARFAAELKETGYAELPEAHERLASMSDEDADWVLGEFKYLSAQIDLTKEIGGNNTPDEDLEPQDRFDAEIKRVQVEDKLGYNAAMKKVVADNPDLARDAGY